MTDSLFKKVEEQELIARDFGFYWESVHQLISQIHSECREVLEAWENQDQSHVQEEMGDLLQAAIGLAVFCNVDPQKALLQATQKFQKRYERLVALAHQEGYKTLHEQPFEVLMKFWDQAKTITNN